MSGKLNQSLDEILSNQRKAAGPRRRSARRTAGRPAPAAPAGGIQKSTRPARNAAKPGNAKAAGLVGESKIMVSNLVSRAPCPCWRIYVAILTVCKPKDVSEGQIKVCYR